MNVANLRKLAKRLRSLRHEEHYNQATWGKKNSCGTAACLAGHAYLLSGKRMEFEREDYWGNGEFLLADGLEDRLPVDAGEFLGLSDEEREVLFNADPDSEDGWSGTSTWPEPFRSRWTNRYKRYRPGMKDQSRRPSRIAADLLDALADGKVTL